MSWPSTPESLRWIKCEVYFQEIYHFDTTRESVRILLVANHKLNFFNFYDEVREIYTLESQIKSVIESSLNS